VRLFLGYEIEDVVSVCISNEHSAKRIEKYFHGNYTSCLKHVKPFTSNRSRQELITKEVIKIYILELNELSFS